MGEPVESTTSSRLPSEEIGRRGRDIYERAIRHQVEADHHGEIVAIDIDSGEWATGEGVTDAVNRLKETCPGAINILSERVGYRGLASFGAGSLRRIR